MNNEAVGNGGGIWNFGFASIHNSMISGNMVGPSGTGGGLWNGGEAAIIDSSTVDNNHSDHGAGIWNETSLEVTNSTISNNFTNGDGGGIHNSGQLSLLNSTVAANSSGGPGTGGGIFAQGTVQATNTIIGINQVGGDCSAPITSLGNNLDSDDTCGLDLGLDDHPGEDPLLEDLGDFGGPTWTHALMPTSPAIDAGNDSMAPLVDQRGFPRPVGGASDIGAFEVQEGGPPGGDPTFSNPLPTIEMLPWSSCLMGLFSGPDDLPLVAARCGRSSPWWTT